MSLPIATEGCCDGHGCDGCKTCQRGRCCRNDNPDYRLPKLGEWDGPIFGALGVVTRPDGDLAECHICGDSFHNVTSHAHRAHDVTADEYRALFGLTYENRPASLTLSAKYRDLALRNHSAERLLPGSVNLGAITDEQRLARLQERNTLRDARRARLGLPGVGEFLRPYQRTLSGDQIKRLARARNQSIVEPHVRHAIRMRAHDGATTATIVREFGVSPATVRRIKADGARERIEVKAR